MASKRGEEILVQAIEAMDPAAAGADPALQQRMAIVLRHLIGAVEETGLTESELVRLCAFFEDVSRSGEWRFLTHVFGLETLIVDLAHGDGSRPVIDNVEGPLYRPGAPEATSPARLMREDEAGDRIVLTGTVRDRQTGEALPGAVIDIWQSDASGVYAEDDDDQPEWNFRRRVSAGPDGRFEIETVVPGCYEIGGLSGLTCARMMKLLGRHGMRPGHIHAKVTARGASDMTAMLYFRGDPWLDSDSIFSVRDNIVVDIEPRGAGEPAIARFDFDLEPAMAEARA